MTFDNLFNLFLRWGRVIRPSDYLVFKSYLKEMLKRKSVMIIKENESIKGIAIFFLSNDYERFLFKPLWDIPEGDDPNGKYIIIDKMACQSWDLSMRRLLQEVIEENFNVLEGHYYHAPLGPHVTINRRRPLNVQRSDLIGCGV